MSRVIFPWQRRQKTAAVAPMLTVTDLGNGEAEIIMYGDVVENDPIDWWTGQPTGELTISSQRILDELDQVRGASHITIRLNSGGGDVFSGLAIYNELKDLPAKKTIHIDGLAASAASIIACAGDEVVVHSGSMMMIHEGYISMFGWYTPSQLDNAKNQCNAVTKAMISIYAAKTGRDEEEIRQQVEDETWFVGQEIIDAGFATAMSESNTDEAQDDGDVDEVVYDAATQTLTVHGIRHDASMCRNIPQSITNEPLIKQHAASITPAAFATVQEPPTAAKPKGETFMNVDELRASHPELVAQIEQQAAEAERQRMQEIDEISASIPAELVARAKYEQPLTAAELALASVKSSHAKAVQFLAEMDEDSDESGAEDVDAAPNGGSEESDEKKDDKEAEAIIKNAAAFVNGSIGRKVM